MDGFIGTNGLDTLIADTYNMIYRDLHSSSPVLIRNYFFGVLACVAHSFISRDLRYPKASVDFRDFAVLKRDIMEVIKKLV